MELANVVKNDEDFGVLVWICFSVEACERKEDGAHDFNSRPSYAV